MNDQQRIAQLIECLDNETPISITIMREGLWAFRRENEELKRKLNPPLATGLEPLSKKRAAVYDFLVKFQTEAGYPPSVREISEGVGLKSSGSVHRYLEDLERLGYIRRDPTKPRAISIIGTREAAPCASSE